MATDVFIVDDQHPEDMAMLQALYSRSPASVVTHLDKLRESGSGKFMDQFYVGYGHSSIGDCGTTTCFIEQVSMLVAKAVQDNPLYNGQEASTRYLDFSKQAVVDPYGHAESKKIQDKWMEIYNRTLEALCIGIEAKHPFDPAIYKNEKVWKNTLRARAFDIARSLLPIGTTTLLSWTTSLRQAREHVRRLKHHPLPEVQEVAKSLFLKFLEKYPHSFQGDEMDEVKTGRDAYAAQFALKNNFVTVEDLEKRFALSGGERADLKNSALIARREAVDLKGIAELERETLQKRPLGAHLPWRLESYGRYNFLFQLDFGSFRDIQRHRNAVCQIPLVDGRYGIHPWYKNQFIELLGTKAAEWLFGEIEDQFARVAALKNFGVQTSSVLNQYLFPMGTATLVHVSYSVPEAVYVGELRSGKTVHPSLRPVAQKILGVLEKDLPGIALYGDKDVEAWTAKRGEQTISAKG